MNWYGFTNDNLCSFALIQIAIDLFVFYIFGREFKILLRRDTELFTDDFVAENSDFDPAKVLTGDVEGTLFVWVVMYTTYTLEYAVKYCLYIPNSIEVALAIGHWAFKLDIRTQCKGLLEWPPNNSFQCAIATAQSSPSYWTRYIWTLGL